MNMGPEYGAASISSSQHSGMIRDGIMFGGGGGNMMMQVMDDNSRDSGCSRLLLHELNQETPRSNFNNMGP